jgi:GTP-binding protein HflX
LRTRTREHLSLEELKRTFLAGEYGEDCVFVSAQKKINIEELRAKLYKEVKEIFAIRYPYNNFLY